MFNIFKNRSLQKDHERRIASTIYGSASLADIQKANHAGMFERKQDSIFLGRLNGRNLYHNDKSGVILVAPPRTGKLTSVIIQNTASASALQNCIVLDIKFEISKITQNQCTNFNQKLYPAKHTIYWNPFLQEGLPHTKINFVDHLNLNNPFVESDTKVFASNMVNKSGDGNGAKFFEQQAEEIINGLALNIIEIKGSLDFLSLIELINALSIGGKEYEGLAYDLSASQFMHVRKLARSFDDWCPDF